MTPGFFSTDALGLYRALFHFKDFLYMFAASLQGHWELVIIATNGKLLGRLKAYTLEMCEN